MKSTIIKGNILFICCFMISCGTPNASPTTDFDWTANEVKITAQQLKSDSIFGRINSMVIDGNNMAVSCIDTDPICTLFEIKGDSLLTRERFLRKGRGPGEAFSTEIQSDGNHRIKRLNYINGDNSVYTLSTASPEAIREIRNWDQQKLKQNSSGFSALIAVNQSDFIAQTFGESPEMVYYATRDSIYPLDIPYPNDGTEASPLVKSIIYCGIWKKHPTQPRFVYTTRNRGRYVFTCTIDTTQHTVTKMQVLEQELPAYTVREDGINAQPSQQMPIPSRIAAGPEYIYLLKAEGTFESPTPNGWSSTQVRVYDWDGNPIRSLRLDRPVNNIHVDAQGRYLYGETLDPTSHEPLLLRLKLPEE